MAAKKVKSTPKQQKPSKKELTELSEKHQRKLIRMREAIETGMIRTFDGLIDIMDITPLAAALGYQGKQIGPKLKDPKKFSMGDAMQLATLTGAAPEKTVLLFLYFAMGWNKDNVKTLPKDSAAISPKN